MEDASRQAELVREGITSSSDLVEQSLNKIEKGNSQLNAVTYLRADRALEEAKRSDHGQPFFGVPILLKGLGQKLAGEPATASSRLLKKLVADQTDFYVQALQKAGFIVIGQTNAPEFGFKNITDPTYKKPVSLSLGKPMPRNSVSKISLTRLFMGQHAIHGILIIILVVLREERPAVWRLILSALPAEVTAAVRFGFRPPSLL